MPAAPNSFARVVQNFRKIGFKEYWRQLNRIGDTKSGTLAGTDYLGNKYYENRDGSEIQGRHRWVDYAADELNASQIPPEWNRWLNSTRDPAPPNDPVIAAVTPSWRQDWAADGNPTGTRAAFRTYNTTAPKYYTWDGAPKRRDG